MHGCVQITKNAFESINCRTIEGVSVLSVQPSIVCGSSEHIGPLILAVMLLIIFVFGVPILMVVLYVRCVDSPSIFLNNHRRQRSRFREKVFR